MGQNSPPILKSVEPTSTEDELQFLSPLQMQVKSPTQNRPSVPN